MQKNRNFIQFKSDLVEQILADRKTQTRRLLKPQPRRQPSATEMPFQPGDKPYTRESYWTNGARIVFGQRPDPSFRFVASMFMAKHLSRCTIEILSVTVERVQDITEENARAEGMLPNWTGDLDGWNPDEHGYLPLNWKQLHGNDDEGIFYTARDAFLATWDYINPAHPVESNPWIAAYLFRKVDHAHQR